jgi:hypothetical protein
MKAMLYTVKQLLINQFEAALCTLEMCIVRCPDAAWDGRVGKLMFCQVAFHTLFYTDFYLGLNEESFRRQPFHLANSDLFRDYEELLDRPQVLLYDKPGVKAYLEYCRNKAADAISVETADSLVAPCDFPRRNMTRAELHVYNIRHIQHHAAQLSLRLRLDFGENIPWVGSGWHSV